MQADQIRQTYTGLFPQLLSQIVDSVCTGCATPTTTYYNLSMDGREPLKDDVNSAIANIDDTTHFTFPIFGQLFIKTYSGYPFVGIVQSQGTAMIVYQPKIVSVGFMRIFTAVVNAKSVLAISMLLMCVVGWFLWFSVSFLLDYFLIAASCQSLIYSRYKLNFRSIETSIATLKTLEASSN